MASNGNVIGRYRQVATRMAEVLKDERGLAAEFVARDLGNELTDEDFVGADAGITKAEFVAAVTSLDAIYTLFNAGHKTNIFRVTN